MKLVHTSVTVVNALISFCLFR